MAPRRSAQAKAVTDLVLGIFRAHGSIIAAGDRLVRKDGLTSARWQVLGAISLAGAPITVPTIARAMGQTRQGVQKQIDRLRADGFVELLPNPAHLGSPLVGLTQMGATTYRDVEARWYAVAAELGKVLTLNEVKSAAQVVEQLSTLMQRKE